MTSERDDAYFFEQTNNTEKSEGEIMVRSLHPRQPVSRFSVTLTLVNSLQRVVSQYLGSGATVESHAGVTSEEIASALTVCQGKRQS